MQNSIVQESEIILEPIVYEDVKEYKVKKAKEINLSEQENKGIQILKCIKIPDVEILSVSKNDSSVTFYKLEREAKILKKIILVEPIIAMDYFKLENKGYFFVMMDLSYSFYLISSQTLDAVKIKESQ